MGSVIRWATDQTFSNTEDGDIVQKIIEGDLIIASGVTVTTQYRCKGLHIQVRGNMYLYGTIDMSARGASATGANVGLEFYSDRNQITLNGASYSGLPTVRKIPSAGANGGAGVTAISNDGKIVVPGRTSGSTGTAGTDGKCGGGGSGSAYATNVATVTTNRGGNGSSFSGGSGSGSASSTISGTFGGIGSDSGGAGGAGYFVIDVSWAGGAGNPGGANGTGGGYGNSGTGGLVIISVLGYLYIHSGAYIKANGSAGVAKSGSGSGGGSINLLYATLTNNGTLQATGGTGHTDTGLSPALVGGSGGAGSIRYNSLWTT